MIKEQEVKHLAEVSKNNLPAHQLFLYIISGTTKLELNEICQALRDKNQLDISNPETGATLLGLATTLLLSEVVLALLQHGADINFPTGLKGENTSLPFTIALKRTTASKPRILYLENKSIPSTLRSIPDMTTSIKERFKILECFLQHPKLNLNQREFTHTTTLGKTVMDWVKELKIETLPLVDSNGKITEQKSFFRRLEHRCLYGLNDLRDSFAPNSNTLIGHNVNKIKRYSHINDYKVVDVENIWIMKSLEKKEYLVQPGAFSTDDLVIDYSADQQGLQKHQAVWSSVNRSKIKYCLYQTKNQWWACGRFERSEVSIVRFETDDDLKTIAPNKKIKLIENIQGRLYYARCLREMIAMEWHRLFNMNQPYYRVVVDDDMSTAAVVVTLLPNPDDLKKAYLKKDSIPYLNGLADMLCDIYITNDLDPNPANFLIINQNIIHIDGDRCWGRLREYTTENRFSIKKSITQLLEQKSLGESAGYYFWNFFDKISRGEKQPSSPLYDWIFSMVKTPQFIKELYVALLKRIFLPGSFIDLFVSYYIPHSYEPVTLQSELLARLGEARNAALENKGFQDYMKRYQAFADMDTFLKNLESFRINFYTFLCSHQDTNIMKIRSFFHDKINELNESTAIKVNSEKHLNLQASPDKQTLEKITSLCRKMTSKIVAEEDIIKDVHQLRESKIDLNLQEPQTGATPLGLAITLLLAEVVAELLRAGADPNLSPHLKGKEKLLPLTVAVGKTHVSETKDLYHDPSQAPKTGSVHDGKNCSCALRRIHVILALLNAPGFKLDIGKADDSGKTVLAHWPHLKDNEPVLYKALEAGMQRDNSLLAFIAFNREFSCFDLIKDGEDKPSIKFQTYVGIYLTKKDLMTSHTLLGLAITLLKPDYVTFLLEAKADINQPTGDQKCHLPITLAARKTHCSILEDNKSKAKVNSVFRCPRLTLMSSGEESCDCSSKKASIMDILLASPKLKLNALEKDGKSTCLNWISHSNRHRQKLSEKGAKTFTQLQQPS